MVNTLRSYYYSAPKICRCAKNFQAHILPNLKIETSIFLLKNVGSNSKNVIELYELALFRCSWMTVGHLSCLCDY